MLREVIFALPRQVVAKVNVEGEKLKRAPAGFDQAHEFVEDLKRKDFCASTRFTQAQVCSASFASDFAAGCKAAAPLWEFLARAMELPW